jgi:hypothetical protein
MNSITSEKASYSLKSVRLEVKLTSLENIMVNSPLVLNYVIFASRFGSILMAFLVLFFFKPVMLKEGSKRGWGTFGMMVRVKEVSALTPPLMRPKSVTV